ncbi:hypothetical protein FHW69_003727 [Luteibacter sp. Sphag1AF]|uniref:hypothetical protein n=1 Tax=Luteibacter sp. Sphag1AF TaxID=2587031 RepID=UPI0016202E94|nr:hypothetical protein [Luteibacter sp. Sphag1AF]MBB3229078.1 hypothetical protein [Luteibacter sp. Sphag1AF]
MSRQPSIDAVRNALARLGDPTAISAFNDLMRELESLDSAHREQHYAWPEPLGTERFTVQSYELGWNNCIYRSQDIHSVPPVATEADFVSIEERRGWNECRALMVSVLAQMNGRQRIRAGLATQSPQQG